MDSPVSYLSITIAADIPHLEIHPLATGCGRSTSLHLPLSSPAAVLSSIDRGSPFLKKMGRRFLHHLLLAVLALCSFAPARSDEWLPATATFYGGADGSDTMGKLTISVLSELVLGTA